MDECCGGDKADGHALLADS
jgi:hypothetical protein